MKDINWKGALPIVEKKYWLQIENRRRFFEELSGKLNIKSLSDWGKVPQSTIKQHGGSTLLRKYGGALIGALRDAFPGEPNFLDSTNCKILNGNKNGLHRRKKKRTKVRKIKKRIHPSIEEFCSIQIEFMREHNTFFN